MKMNVVPGINVNTKKELLKKLKQIQPVKTVHIDVEDGRFVEHKTIQSKEINSVKNIPQIQIHYMGYQPLNESKKYKRINAFIFHVETEENIIRTIKEIKKQNITAGIAFNPETQIKDYCNEIKNADIALVMTVNPGLSGQRMIKDHLKKISQIRKINKKIIVGVDGGVNKLTIKKIRANFAVVTSTIFNSPNPKKKLRELQAQVL